MRIISGKFKGRRLEVSQKLSARPTTDFAKEGLFNLLNNRIDFEDIRVLDLFAGTGSIGIEFISRGCQEVIAVELSERNCASIRKACQILQIDNLFLHRADVFKFISHCHTQFDVIYADPPYDSDKITDLPDLILQQDLLSENGIFILEHSAKQQFDDHPHFDFHRKYGNVHFSIFKLEREG